ncbi:MAG: response regulator [Acetobacteraceae bacterium]|nr:response regulator [Acetobacteraceae bacterium]
MTFAAAPHPLSILVVDDEQPIRELLGWMLGDAGHVVHEAREGKEALDFLRRNGRVDIILSDINMPVMDGVELSNRVQAEWPDLPVLLISGRPPPKGVRAFIAKPFRWEMLAEAIALLAGPSRSQTGCA